MKNLVTTIALVLAVCFGVAFNVSDVEAAVTAPVAGVARATASADVIDDELPYGATVVGVKVNPATANKYYRLRNGSASGERAAARTSDSAECAVIRRIW